MRADDFKRAANADVQRIPHRWLWPNRLKRRLRFWKAWLGGLFSESGFPKANSGAKQGPECSIFTNVFECDCACKALPRPYPKRQAETFSLLTDLPHGRSTPSTSHQEHSMGLFDLGRVQNAIQEATGLEVTHAYQDLVFVEHSAFLIQFDATDLKRFICHFNQECPVEDREKLLPRIQAAAIQNGLTCMEGKIFTLEQVPDQEDIRIQFA
jgi:hypothetical protein